ncbi:hypothetical protein, partial [Mesorhizobium sp. M1A.F.Ca.IN.020.04.1.1]|uniref:hypothetical protein n=1 Tax=Mesorhizobium sp. M1A.F.Ca.IN.020.04.1.1 TaxID=2496761 RepID=UPI0019D12C6A
GGSLLAGSELLDTPFVQTEHPLGAALALEVGLEFVPRTQIFAAFGTMDLGNGLSIDGDLQPDHTAIRAFQFVIQIPTGDHRPPSRNRQVCASRRFLCMPPGGTSDSGATRRSNQRLKALRHALRHRAPACLYLMQNAFMTGETIQNDGWCERARQTAAVPGLRDAMAFSAQR